MTTNGPESDTGIHLMDEAVETLRAIQEGAVDAFVVEEPEGHRVYTLQGADLPYSVLVDRMQQGAAMLNANGDIIYCNPSLADMLGVPLATTIGVPLQNFLEPEEQSSCQKMLSEIKLAPREGEFHLRRADGTVTLAHFFFRSL